MARTVQHPWERSRTSARADEPSQAVAVAMQRTVELWNEHGLLMRTAIDRVVDIPTGHEEDPPLAAGLPGARL